MLDESLKKNIKARIRLEKEGHEEQLRLELQRIRAQAAATGMFGSGNMLYLINETCRLAVRNRGQLIWNTIHRFITTAGVSYSSSLREELLDLFKENFRPPDDINGLRETALTAGIGRNQAAESQLEESFGKSRSDTLEIIAGEIDLFLTAMKKNESEGNKGSTMNFYAPVGSVQTGANSTAYVTQNISVDARTTLVSAFDEIIKELSKSQIVPQREELIEVVQDAKTEIAKSKPNALRLQSYIVTIGTMIQAVAALKPAYGLLKLGAAHFGITLP